MDIETTHGGLGVDPHQFAGSAVDIETDGEISLVARHAEAVCYAGPCVAQTPPQRPDDDLLPHDPPWALWALGPLDP